jgi:hypothetical protein
VIGGGEGVHEFEALVVDVLSQFIPLEGRVSLFLVLVGEAQVVVEHERVQLGVLLHGCENVSITELESVEHVADVDMCGLILVVVFAALEVPIHGRLVLFQYLVVGADVVVAVGELRSDLDALHVPWDGLQTIIAYSDIISHPHVFWKFLCHYFELGDLVICLLLVSCKDKVSVHVLGFHCQNLAGRGYGFGFLDPAVFIDQGEADVGVDEGRPFLNGFIVCLDGLIVFAPIVEDVTIADKKFSRFIKADHILVPEDAPIRFLLIGVPDDIVAEGKRIEGVAFDLACGALLVIPTVDEPFVPAGGVLVVSESSNFKIDGVALLDHLLIDVDGLH